ncbi:myelin-oligodendrocyte glycoprotein-like [Dicentrarchus labrax]|uniref:myelin-oligodendrocyte glycoprotein-like n=1 Tax=Dicentrarchus labrax TaxID=13489 RepID=UPI0021F532EA|nr:myelin-oligodendrocyte glycoprotein-like [Dicentrarchus labrax]
MDAATGQSEVIGSDKPVTVTVGDNVILPCHLEPPFNVRTLTVEWTHDREYVHIWRHEKDYLTDQDENFRGRTSLFHEEMIRGNISLKLTNVTELDAGSYTCFVPKLQSQVRRGFINLTVEPVGGQTNNTSGGTGFSTGAITGMAVGIPVSVFAVIAIVVALVVLWMNRRKIRQSWANVGANISVRSICPCCFTGQGVNDGANDEANAEGMPMNLIARGQEREYLPVQMDNPEAHAV